MGRKARDWTGAVIGGWRVLSRVSAGSGNASWLLECAGGLHRRTVRSDHFNRDMRPCRECGSPPGGYWSAVQSHRGVKRQATAVRDAAGRYTAAPINPLAGHINPLRPATTLSTGGEVILRQEATLKSGGWGNRVDWAQSPQPSRSASAATNGSDTVDTATPDHHRAVAPPVVTAIWKTSWSDPEYQAVESRASATGWVGYRIWDGLREAWSRRFPYAPTAAQRAILADIVRDWPETAASWVDGARRGASAREVVDAVMAGRDGMRAMAREAARAEDADRPSRDGRPCCPRCAADGYCSACGCGCDRGILES